MTVVTSTGVPRVGTYRWHRRCWRRWSGRQWAEATYSAFPKRLEPAAGLGDLPRAARSPVASGCSSWRSTWRSSPAAGWCNRSSDGVTLAYQRSVTHVGHFILTLLTGGLWGFVWIAVILSRKENRVRYEVDPWGNIWPVAAP